MPSGGVVSWTIPGSAIRHTGCDVGYRPHSWTCEPCAPSHRRYVVDGSEYPWFAIVDPLDSDRAAATKLQAMSRAEQLRGRIRELNAELRTVGAP